MSNENSLSGKVAFVTGAGQGIGEAIARELAARGANVIVTDINGETASATARSISENGPEAISFTHDAASSDDWELIMEGVARKFGKVDILVSNAGIIDVTAFADMTEEVFDRIMRVNVKGPFLGAKAVVPMMAKNGGGVIINMSSINGVVAHMPGQTAYAASKGAVRLFTKALALEVADKNIRVNSVHPGVIASPFVQPYLDDPEFRPVVLNRTLMKRPGETSEIAKVVAFLASDDASFMTGSEVVVDGGFLSA